MTAHKDAQRLERLLEICRMLSTTLELQKVLHVVIQAAMELTGSEAASILLYDGESNHLQFVAATPGHWEVLKHQIVPLRGSLAGRAFVERRPIVEENVPHSPRHFRQVDQSLDFVTHNLVAVPLLRENEPLGVLEALNKDGGFSNEDVEALNLLASHAAVALHNARLMEQVRQAYRELQEVDRMKSDFIAVASHELRTPLGIILGYATHLQEVLEPPYQAPVQTLVRAAMRLKEVVEDLGHLENYQHDKTILQAQRIDLTALLREATAPFEEQATEKGLRLELRLPEQAVYAEVDAEKIRVLLRHLLKNALTFTDAGGEIVVGLSEEDEYAQITVRDTGVGIPEKDLPHVFDRFYQVEKHLTRRHGGLGLGLSIAKTMVDAHGGAIWAESVEGEGTTIVVMLPRLQKRATPLQRVLRT